MTGYCLRSNPFLTSSAGNQATSSSSARFRPLHLLRRDSGELISRFSSHNPLLLLRRPFHSPEENSTKPDTSNDDTSDLHRGWNGLRRIGIGNPEETQGDGRARVGRWRWKIKLWVSLSPSLLHPALSLSPALAGISPEKMKWPDYRLSWSKRVKSSL